MSAARTTSSGNCGATASAFANGEELREGGGERAGGVGLLIDVGGVDDERVPGLAQQLLAAREALARIKRGCGGDTGSVISRG